MQAFQHATQKSFSSLTNRGDQGDDLCHEEKYLEGSNRGGIYHLPVLFQSLDGEFERSGMGLKRGVVWAIEDVFTIANFEIAATAGLIGYVVFEFLRKRF
jgi:hypothetical protein